MKTNGWSFNVTTSITTSHRPECKTENINWYGWGSGDKAGTASVTLAGYGRAELNFGNCFNKGVVQVFLSDTLLSSATASQLSKKVMFNYHKGDVLTIIELGDGNIKLNSLTFNCGGEYGNYLENRYK